MPGRPEDQPAGRPGWRYTAASGDARPAGNRPVPGPAYRRDHGLEYPRFRGQCPSDLVGQSAKESDGSGCGEQEVHQGVQGRTRAWQTGRATGLPWVRQVFADHPSYRSPVACLTAQRRKSGANMITTPNITCSHRNGHHPPAPPDPAPVAERDQPQPPWPPGNPAASHAGKTRPARPATMTPILTRPNDFALSPGSRTAPRNSTLTP